MEQEANATIFGKAMANFLLCNLKVMKMKIIDEEKTLNDKEILEVLAGLFKDMMY